MKFSETAEDRHGFGGPLEGGGFDQVLQLLNGPQVVLQDCTHKMYLLDVKKEHR